MKVCPCCSEKSYDQCCGSIIEGSQIAKTPEELMRSRYTAYTLANITYISDTMTGPANNDFDPGIAESWAKQARWLGLSILDAPKPDNDVGFVEFAARYKFNNKLEILHERSEFRQIDGRWFYYNGHTSKIGRNGACVCGSGKKFKKCCGI